MYILENIKRGTFLDFTLSLTEKVKKLPSCFVLNSLKGGNFSNYEFKKCIHFFYQFSSINLVLCTQCLHKPKHKIKHVGFTENIITPAFLHYCAIIQLSDCIWRFLPKSSFNFFPFQKIYVEYVFLTSLQYKAHYQEMSGYGYEDNTRRPMGGKSTYFRRDDDLDTLWKNNTQTGINFNKYDNIEVDAKGDNIPKPISTFEEAGFNRLLTSNIKRAEYKALTDFDRT